jgi:hypothetical protein
MQRQFRDASPTERPRLSIVVEHEESDNQSLDIRATMTNQQPSRGTNFSTELSYRFVVSDQPDI